MKDDSSFYVGQDIELTIEYLISSFSIVLSWIIWIILTGGVVVGSVCLDNEWLEDQMIFIHSGIVLSITYEWVQFISKRPAE